MSHEWRVLVSHSVDKSVTALMDQVREVGGKNPQHVLGAMLGDAIVAMAPDDAANVLQALIQRLDVLDDESLKPFCKLALLWRVWQTRGGDEDFFVVVEEEK